MRRTCVKSFLAETLTSRGGARVGPLTSRDRRERMARAEAAKREAGDDDEDLLHTTILSVRPCRLH